MRYAIGLAGTLLLAACSGNSGSGTPAPTPTPSGPNTAPTFTSATTATLVENAALSYTATATDAQSNPITYSVAGGADAARFSITTTGVLTFIAAPNFDLPGDADGDNVYQVQLGASDGALSTTLNLAVTVTNSREGIAVKRVGTGFNQPLAVAAIPGSSNVYVAEKGGGIWRLDPATGVKTLVRTIDNLSTDGERGLLGMVVNTRSPGAYGESFVVATAPDGAVQVRACTLTNPFPFCSIVLSTPHPTNNNHNGGWIDFGPDGNLYVATGDGGGGGDPANNAQNPNSRLGKILRIALNPDPFAGAAPLYYLPAPGNPFIAGGGDPYVWALGLRNPFRNSFDGNRLIIADVGQDAIEEINVVNVTQPGLNFGWKFLEGTQPYSGTAPAGLTAPVSQYGHGTGPRQGSSITGGYVYRGPVASLVGQYVFGDFVSGNIWSLPAASLVQGSLFPSAQYERRNQDFAPDVGAITGLASFGTDSAGNLFLVDIGGSIYMVQPG
ncbi:MAG: cadherin domain-containing protein [Sphingomonadales bacterium]|nr:MAG: cadherin domain-containing protein [Sphingomonadales bacterium]